MSSSNSDSTSQKPMHSETAKKATLPHTGDNASLANLVGVGALLGGALLTKKKKGKA
ncbi:LPXTG cell wall anchor domain-containing protein [Streptococcus iniae]|nr:LPXTG cell wall anchor domain-containing protein [Streptococcus iniae]WNZ97352.1 LPXTG cell wall anchor domain-containing protein [Streptococcus iniae]